jgi:hypothetical protein
MRLGDPRTLSRADERAVQKAELARVRSVIGQAVLDFAREHHREFFADELRAYVLRRANVAPASPDRILRDLRKRRLLNYEVTNRRASRYRFLPVPEYAK